MSVGQPTVAEHVPACNVAFRKQALELISGFEPQFRIAGDDVDGCWRVLGSGHKLAFSPAAVVWHHPRDSIRAYWRQQLGCGRAEAMPERKWPKRYRPWGRAQWSGCMYTRAFQALGRWLRGRRLVRCALDRPRDGDHRALVVAATVLGAARQATLDT